MRRFLFALVVLFSTAALPAIASSSHPVSAKKAENKTGIEWNVSPPAALVFLDGKKLGSAGDLKFTKAQAGKHTIRLTKGGDEQEFEVKVTKGQVLRVDFSFSE